MIAVANTIYCFASQHINASYRKLSIDLICDFDTIYRKSNRIMVEHIVSFLCSYFRALKRTSIRSLKLRKETDLKLKLEDAYLTSSASISHIVVSNTSGASWLGAEGAMAPHFFKIVKFFWKF